MLAAAGAYRVARSRGRGRWAAANNGLSWVFPHAIAWLILVQVKVSIDLLRVPRRLRPRPEHFTIHHDPLLRTLFWLNVALTGLTLAIVEMLLFLGRGPWPWHLLDLGGNAYQLWILGGLWATFATRPLRVGPDRLTLRAGVVGEIDIPFQDIADARPVRREVASIWSWGRFIFGPGARTLTLTAGTPLNVLLILRAPAHFDPYQSGKLSTSVERVLLRVDEPQRFLETLARRLGEGRSYTNACHFGAAGVPLYTNGPNPPLQVGGVEHRLP